jgi:nitrogen fixation protein NifB
MVLIMNRIIKNMVVKNDIRWNLEKILKEIRSTIISNSSSVISGMDRSYRYYNRRYKSISKKMIVKVNTVYIPGINDAHIPAIAKKVGEMGVFTFNVIPLIPQYKFASIAPPTPEMKRKMQDACAPYVRQMRHCQRCRSDAIGKLGRDVQACLYAQE